MAVATTKVESNIGYFSLFLLFRQQQLTVVKDISISGQGSVSRRIGLKVQLPLGSLLSASFPLCLLANSLLGMAKERIECVETAQSHQPLSVEMSEISRGELPKRVTAVHTTSAWLAAPSKGTWLG